jgi:predicted transcriptional regulator
MTTDRTSAAREGGDELTLRTRRPAGAVLSVRVPGTLAVAADEFARSSDVSLSELVRAAIEHYLTWRAAIQAPTLYGSTREASLVLNSPEVEVLQPTRGEAQTETRAASGELVSA